MRPPLETLARWNAWVNAAAWRWRTGHFVVGFFLTLAVWWLGLWTFAIHEGTQYLGPGRKPIREHVLDFAAAFVGAALAWGVR